MRSRSISASVWNSTSGHWIAWLEEMDLPKLLELGVNRYVQRKDDRG